MLDVQGLEDTRKLAIQRVGVKDVTHPMIWEEKNAKQFPSMGKFNIYVGLSAEQKGAHMSRMIEELYKYDGQFSIMKLLELGKTVQKVSHATLSEIGTTFTYFFEREAPVTKTRGIADVLINVKVTTQNEKQNIEFTVQVPVISLCPCSKAISKHGAHNQRSHLTITVYDNPNVSISEIISAAEKAASGAMYPVLKREDEKFVTEFAYENPRFVEDMVREASIQMKNTQLGKYLIVAENFESIHNHNVWASISSESV